jgi:hypothetical protein
MNAIESTYHPSTRIVTTRLQGSVTVEEVSRWLASLAEAIGQIEDNSQFKLLVDLYNYEPAALPAHKAMRPVVPLMLARYGFRTALLDLFDPAELPLQNLRGITCTAVAHVHHDPSKMDEYDRRLGRANEHFFTDPSKAQAWLETAVF